MIFNEVILHDFSRPLAKRAADRKYCGPYHWTPSEPGTGRGFYTASKGLACAPHGSGFDLRLEDANEYIATRLSQITGYYCDDDGEGETLKPIIARLPKNRGFLAGWTMGAGMCAALDCDIYKTPQAAAFAAHSKAEHDAEASREADAKWREEEAAREAEEAAAQAEDDAFQNA